MSYEGCDGLRVSLDDRVLRLTLDRPDKRNAIDEDMTAGLVDALDAANRDEDVRVVLLSGEGDHFCSGADIVAGNRASDERPRVGSIQRRLPSLAHRLVPLVCEVQVPVVCAVRGYCAGLGFHLAVAADFTVAATDATFWEPFAQRGFTPDSGATWLLPRRVGAVRARELLLLGRRLSGIEAHEWGLVHAAVAPERLDEEVDAVVDQLVAGPTVTLGLTKWLLHEGEARAMREHLVDEAFALELSSRSEDFREGLAAFREKRPPEFKGRSMARGERYESLRVEREGHVGWLVFDRPSVGNAMDATMLAELEQAWQELDRDPGVRVIVNTGEGPSFQTGLDVKQLATDKDALREQSRRTKRAELKLTAWHNGVRKPVIAAVNGVCAGGGLHFVADADIVIAASDAVFLDPHVSIGQVTAYEAIALVRKSPMEAIMRMALTGRYEQITAARAYQLGIVGEVVDPPERLRDAARDLATKVARNSPAAMAATKHALWSALELGLTDACRAGVEDLVSLWGHPDQVEGPAAFVEKREARWQEI